MAKQGKHGIAWTEQTWGPIRGCSRVSSGCKNCYAERIAARFNGPGQPYEGLAVIKSDGPHWTGKVRLVGERLEDPLRWKKPRMIFVNSMSDLFHEALAEEDILKVIDVMIRSLRKVDHIFQVLTKRPERMREILGKINPIHIDRRIWWGVSVEDQKTADERIPILLDTPAAIRWVSYEPALGSVDFQKYLEGKEEYGVDFSRPVGSKVGCCVGWTPPLDWIVCGGESGPHARPMELEWASQLRRQCQEAGVPFFMKQFSEANWVHFKVFETFPSEVRVREYPKI